MATSSIRYYESIGLLPEPVRRSGRRRYGADVLGTLAFIAVAQSAGFRLEEIKELVRGADGEGDMAPRLRDLSERKLGEVEALLERTRAMKGWLEVANGCDCRTPLECTLFQTDADQPDAAAALRVVQVPGGGGCRRVPPVPPPGRAHTG